MPVKRETTKKIEKVPVRQSAEETYAQIMFGHDEPQTLCLYGSTLVAMAREAGRPATHTSDGTPIREDAYYQVTRGHIVEVA